MVVRFIRFTLVGAFATGIQYLVLILLVQKMGSGPVAASAIGFIVSAFANYIINYHYTFGSSQPHFAAMAKFSVLASVGLLLNSLIMAALVRFELHYLAAQAAATVTVLLWNFTGNSLWTFRETTRRQAARIESRTGARSSRQQARAGRPNSATRRGEG